MPTQAEYWNEAGGSSWVAGQEELDAQLAPFGALALEAASFRPGEAVIDVGCGCGATTIAIAARVGETGRDRRARRLGADARALRHERISEPNVELVLGDAATAPLPDASFDAVFSRFGVMFFDDAGATIRDLRAALRPGGRMALVVWQDLTRNPWITVPAAAVEGLVKPLVLGDSDEPGPFSLGDPDHLRTLLETAGYSDVDLTGHELAMTIGGGLAFRRRGRVHDRTRPAAARAPRPPRPTSSPRRPNAWQPRSRRTTAPRACGWTRPCGS